MEENLNIQGQLENNGSDGEMDVKKINVNIIDGGRDGSNIKEPKKENKFLSRRSRANSFSFGSFSPNP